MFRIIAKTKEPPFLKNVFEAKNKLDQRITAMVEEWAQDVVGVMKKNVTGGGGSTKSLNVRSGRLRNSLRAKVQKDTVTFGSDVEYARIHEYGGKTRSHRINPRKGNVLSFIARGGQRAFAKYVLHPGSRIPARPYMRPAIKTMLPKLKERIISVLKLTGEGL